MHGAVPTSASDGDRLAQILAERKRDKKQWASIYDSIVIVAGSRTFNDYVLFASFMDDWLANNEKHLGPLWTFLSGDARDGPDAMIKRYAGIVDEHYRPITDRESRYDCKLLPALWDWFDKRAGYMRNHEMGEIATHLIAFHAGGSRGTRDMIDFSRKIGIDPAVVLVNEDPDKRKRYV